VPDITGDFSFLRWSVRSKSAPECRATMKRLPDLPGFFKEGEENRVGRARFLCPTLRGFLVPTLEREKQDCPRMSGNDEAVARPTRLPGSIKPFYRLRVRRLAAERVDSIWLGGGGRW
jgi:hypothetical protein